MKNRVTGVFRVNPCSLGEMLWWIAVGGGRIGRIASRIGLGDCRARWMRTGCKWHAKVCNVRLHKKKNENDVFLPLLTQIWAFAAFWRFFVMMSAWRHRWVPGMTGWCGRSLGRWRGTRHGGGVRTEADVVAMTRGDNGLSQGRRDRRRFVVLSDCLLYGSGIFQRGSDAIVWRHASLVWRRNR